MLPLLQLAAALQSVALASAHGPWSQAIGYRHLLGPPPGQTGPPQPLWGGAAQTVGARFTPMGRFDSIYLANDPITSFIEVSALILLPGLTRLRGLSGAAHLPVGIESSRSISCLTQMQGDGR